MENEISSDSRARRGGTWRHVSASRHVTSRRVAARRVASRRVASRHPRRVQPAVYLHRPSMVSTLWRWGSDVKTSTIGFDRCILTPTSKTRNVTLCEKHWNTMIDQGSVQSAPPLKFPDHACLTNLFCMFLNHVGKQSQRRVHSAGVSLPCCMPFTQSWTNKGFHTDDAASAF